MPGHLKLAEILTQNYLELKITVVLHGDPQSVVAHTCSLVAMIATSIFFFLRFVTSVARPKTGSQLAWSKLIFSWGNHEDCSDNSKFLKGPQPGSPNLDCSTRLTGWSNDHFALANVGISFPSLFFFLLLLKNLFRLRFETNTRRVHEIASDLHVSLDT